MRTLVERAVVGSGVLLWEPLGGGPAEAIRVGGCVLDPGWSLPDALPARAVPTLILAAGSLASEGVVDPRTWLAPGRRALDERCDAIVPPLRERGWSICWQPHARHVLSDGPSTLRFLSDHADASFGLALAPHALFEPSMLRDAGEHLERILSLLAPSSRFLILADAALDPATGACVPAPLGQGRLPVGALRELIRAHAAPDVPLLFAAGDSGEQRAWLDG